MAEKFPNIEKIFRKIETKSSAPKEPVTSAEPGEKEFLEFSPEEKAEQLWAYWIEYRRKKYEILKAEKKKSRAERKELKEVEESPEISQLKTQISKLWRDERVQELFKRNLRENLADREKIKPHLADYRRQEEKLEKSRREYEILLQSLFGQRGKEPDELTQVRIAELGTQIEILKEELERVFRENPELAAFVQYERITEYHRQFEKTGGFIWTPSREKLFEEILDHLVLSGKNRPLLLVGDTGTGKTSLARAAVERLTGRPAFEVGEEAKTDIRPLLGSVWMEEGRVFINYGPLGQALTGKKTSLDKESDGGGIFYMDEMNGYPPDALRSLIKQVSGRAPGEEITFAAWRGIREKIAEKFALIGSANLPDEERGRHLDRPALPVEIIRELTTLQVDYHDRLEIYEMALGALMDRNRRIRLKEGELEANWQTEVNPNTKEKTMVLNSDPKSGGTLWRFSGLVSEIQKSSKGEDNILTPTKSKREASFLESAVLDPGVILAWLREYRISKLRRGVELKRFLQDKLKGWINKKTHPQEDRSLLKEFCSAFDLPVEGPDAAKSDIKGRKIWSEKEIGFLSPRVPRPKEVAGQPKPTLEFTFLEDGTQIEYLPSENRGQKIAGRILRGTTPEGKIVLENAENGEIEVVETSKWEGIQRNFYLKELRVSLENTLEKKGAKGLDEKIQQFIDLLVSEIQKKKEAESLRRRLEKGLEGKSPREKIEYFLNQF